MAKKKKKKALPKVLPEKFVERLTEMFGESSVREIKKTFQKRQTTFRINTIKASKDDVLPLLQQRGFKVKNVPWYSDAFVLENKTKRELTELDIYKEGKIYIQSLASMVPPLVLDPKPGETVLDLTAAPGSKTSQIAALMQKQGELIGNDVNKVRFFRLQANMENLGVSAETDGWQFALRLEDGSVLCQEYEEPYFDKILVDAICSSEARFVDGDPKSFGYWSEHKIKQVAYRQHKLLMAAWSVLKPGGVLVYSTCTLAPEENESRVSKLLERCDDAVLENVEISHLKSLPTLTQWRGKEFHKDIKKTLRVYPTKEIESFFVAKIRKKVD